MPWQGLYAFWGTRISEWLNEALADQGDDVLLNLAPAITSRRSNAAPEGAHYQHRVQDLKNGQYKIISFYAKRPAA